ncbi:unnamed protein product [Lasius platythorax]|uniref:Gustatory receptor n=1 Tax=Lasius platythorax TaxID=488582 RepID=A0AAV2N962_9HYME
MTKTIQAVVSPLLIIGSFCGLGFFEYPLGRPRPYLTCLYFLIIWSLYAYLFYYLAYISDTLHIYLSETNIMIMFTTIVSMLVSLFRFKEFKICLNKLSIVDDTLELLKTPKEYRLLHKWIIGIIIKWILLSLLIDVSDSLWLNYEHFSVTRIFVPLVTNYLLHINTYSAFIWAVILGYTGSRFQRINEHIRNLLEDDTECIKGQNKLILIRNKRRTKIKKSKQYMWILMHVHLQLCLISCELNKIFGIQMTLQMASQFVFSIDTCCHVYAAYAKDDTTIGTFLDHIFNFIWAVVHNANLLVLNYICQSVCNKANKTSAILYNLSNESSDEDLREQTLQFILQIKQKKLKFSGMGLFYFGYDFIRKFYVSVAALLVIIIQMDIYVPID